jgi:hypothetical protein
MPQTTPEMEKLTRDDAIARLREELIRMTDEDRCICDVAAEQKIFCNGFRRYSEGDLRKRYWWIVRRRPDITREELEAIANDWQLAQQQVQNEQLACDVQTRFHDTCRGWHDFSNEDIAAFYKQVVGKDVKVVPTPPVQ